MRNSNEKTGIHNARQLPYTLIEQRRPLNNAKVEVEDYEVVIGAEGRAIR
jgi:hypothetical protein